jgi:hypothetical protein
MRWIEPMRIGAVVAMAGHPLGRGVRCAMIRAVGGTG